MLSHDLRMCRQHAAWAGNPDAIERIVKEYGGRLDERTKTGRTAAQVADERKHASARLKLDELAVEPGPSPNKKAKLAGGGSGENTDVFGVWPTPMTGGNNPWNQFVSLFKSEIAGLTSWLKDDGVTKLEVGSVMRTGVRIIDGRRKLKQWQAAQERAWLELRFKADPLGFADFAKFEKKFLAVEANKTALKAHMDSVKAQIPDALKVPSATALLFFASCSQHCPRRCRISLKAGTSIRPRWMRTWRSRRSTLTAA